MKTKAFLIAGAGSGAGKTTLTLGLMAALKKRGMNVQGFKAGPDYIDPSLHRIITGAPSINLDTWMMPYDFLQHSFTSRSANADVSVIEGVMGLHDGREPDSPTGSTAELAVTMNVPVVLVINASAMARTAAAIVNGLVTFDPAVNIIGVVFNRIGGPKHLDILKKAVKAYCTVPVLGGIPKNEDIAMPSRHLGLFMGEDGVLDQEKINGLETLVSTHVDVDTILRCSDIDVTVTQAIPAASPPWPKRIAVARDEAFCFYYEDNFEVLKRLGYEIKFFSPLKDAHLPRNVSLYYFGGGYPELYAQTLSKNRSMRAAVLAASRNNAFVYGECGGLMYLGETLTAQDGKRFPMCGCLPYQTVMKGRLQSLGYTEVRLQEDFHFLRHAIPLRGHCFHYSDMIVDSHKRMDNVYTGTPPEKAKGYRVRNTLASYVHLHFSGLLKET